jgi:hypothetical protein
MPTIGFLSAVSPGPFARGSLHSIKA